MKFYKLYLSLLVLILVLDKLGTEYVTYKLITQINCFMYMNT